MRRVMIFALLLFAVAHTACAADRPNVLFIAIDDLRPELGCYGSDMALTPNFDRLASTGLLFDRAFCSVAVCGASRASLLTGLYPIGRTRFVSYDAYAEKDAPGAVTLPQAFKQAGYTTLSNGKVFHHRDDTEARSWSGPAWRPGGPASLLPETDAHKSKRGRGAIIEAADVDDNAYPDGKIAEKTIADLRSLKAAGKPFFLACGFLKPHLPFYAPKKYWDLYDRDKLPLADNRYAPKDAPPALHGSGEYNSYYLGDLKVNSDDWHRTMRHGYLACASYVDAQLGRVLDELDTLGLADNTVVIIWGDHGWHLGEHNFWGKHNTLENAARIPLIIRIPEGVLKTNAVGKKTSAMVESVDLFPTLCELAGVPEPDTLQGRSMLHLFQDPSAKHRDSVFCRFIAADTVFTERYAYTRYDTRAGWRMLYDHDNDPQENRNVVKHADYAETVKQLDALLQSRMDEAAGK